VFLVDDRDIIQGRCPSFRELCPAVYVFLKKSQKLVRVKIASANTELCNELRLISHSRTTRIHGRWCRNVFVLALASLSSCATRCLKKLWERWFFVDFSWSLSRSGLGAYSEGRVDDKHISTRQLNYMEKRWENHKYFNLLLAFPAIARLCL
jgi:hypothetical protein